MLARGALVTVLGLATLVVLPGCLFVPKSQLTALESKNRALVEKHDALTARIRNLETHSRNVEDQLMRAEEDLALLEQEAGLDRQQLDNYAALVAQASRLQFGQGRQDACTTTKRDQREASLLGLIRGRYAPPPEMRSRLAQISRQCPSLRFDPYTAAAKLDTDVLFDVGRAELKPGAEEVLGELVRVLNSPEGRDFRVLVVGHTDDRQIVKPPARDKYPHNFHLSAARALAVFDALRRLGLEPERMGVAAFGAHQPVAPNLTGEDRRKNRRVELFVMAPAVPVIGWTETTPTLYR